MRGRWYGESEKPGFQQGSVRPIVFRRMGDQRRRLLRIRRDGAAESEEGIDIRHFRISFTITDTFEKTGFLRWLPVQGQRVLGQQQGPELHDRKVIGEEPAGDIVR